MLDALWGEREPLPPGTPGGTRGLSAPVHRAKKAPARLHWPQRSQSAGERPKSGSAEMPEFSQAQEPPEANVQKLQTKGLSSRP